MSSTLLTACFAAARKALAKARVAQREAILASIDQYRGGARGRKARLAFRRYDRQRSACLTEALRIRSRIHTLRLELHALETAPTDAPPAHP